MPSRKHPARIRPFTKRDIKNLLADLELYSGNIHKITDLHGPHEHNGGRIGGVIHTWMDAYNFSASPLFCDETSWTIELANPVESLRRGHRILQCFTFPKLHKDSALQKRYRVANLLYHAYDGYSNVSEASRLPHYERILGYERLRSYSQVLQAIIKDYRSYQQKREDERRALYSRN